MQDCGDCGNGKLRSNDDLEKNGSKSRCIECKVAIRDAMKYRCPTDKCENWCESKKS